jgi:hypothetical protein
MKKLELYLIVLFFPLLVLLDFCGWNLMFRKSYGYRSFLQCLKEDCDMVITQCNEAGIEDYDMNKNLDTSTH